MDSSRPVPIIYPPPLHLLRYSRELDNQTIDQILKQLESSLSFSIQRNSSFVNQPQQPSPNYANYGMMNNSVGSVGSVYNVQPPPQTYGNPITPQSSNYYNVNYVNPSPSSTQSFYQQTTQPPMYNQPSVINNQTVLPPMPHLQQQPQQIDSIIGPNRLSSMPVRWVQLLQKHQTASSFMVSEEEIEASLEMEVSDEAVIQKMLCQWDEQQIKLKPGEKAQWVSQVLDVSSEYSLEWAATNMIGPASTYPKYGKLCEMTLLI